MFLDPSFLWALAGFLLIASEFIVPGLVIIFFGLGALVTGLLSAIIPGLGTLYGFQALIWLGASVVSLVSLRKTLAKVFKGKMLPDASATEDAAGKTARVIEEISPDKPGRIRYQGTSWEAESYTEKLEVGEEVTILKQDNLTFIVTRSLLEEGRDDDEV